MKNKDIMGKVIKLTEEEIFNIIKQKKNEALEHNVDLDYSPAIGNKKRGPGKESMDQMKKRKNTKLDEDIDERDIIRRYPDGYEDYDGDDGVGDTGSGNYTIDISDDIVDAFREVFSKKMGDDIDWDSFADEKYEEFNLPAEIEVDVDIQDNYDEGDYWTAPSGGKYINDYEIVSGQIENYPPEIQEAIKIAVSNHMDKIDDVSYIREAKTSVRLTQSQLHNYISESVKMVLSEIGYHEKQPKEQSEDKYREWLKKKSAAKKRYYDSQKKEKKDGAGHTPPLF